MKKLTKKQSQEVEKIMKLALDWLETWDVVGEKKNPEPEKDRVAAMYRLKDEVTELVRMAMPNA